MNPKTDKTTAFFTPKSDKGVNNESPVFATVKMSLLLFQDIRNFLKIGFAVRSQSLF